VINNAALVISPRDPTKLPRTSGINSGSMRMRFGRTLAAQ
jgi:hypothetical protein